MQSPAGNVHDRLVTGNICTAVHRLPLHSTTRPIVITNTTKKVRRAEVIKVSTSAHGGRGTGNGLNEGEVIKVDTRDGKFVSRV